MSIDSDAATPEESGASRLHALLWLGPCTAASAFPCVISCVPLPAASGVAASASDRVAADL